MIDMKDIFLSTIILMLPLLGVSQQYAGPTQTACSSTGAVLGVGSPDPDHCYLWEVADGLTPEQVNETNPLVKPNRTTVYSVTVTDQEFSFRAIDRCTVKVDFGGLEIQPRYIEPNGEPNQAQAELTINGTPPFPPDPITWSISADPDGTGCSIDQNGSISNCSSAGTVTIRATNDNNTACIAEKDIEVNVGVRDVVVRDLSHPGREAHAGDTLYMIGNGDIEFQAYPNEESSFPDGQPEWSGDLSPPPGNEYIWMADVGIGTYTVTAGEKTVVVWRFPPSVVQTGFNIDLEGFNKLKEMLTNGSPAGDLQSGLCTPIPIGVTLPTVIQGNYKEELVPKYQDPNLGYKQEINLNVPAIGVAGCMPLPCCVTYLQLPNGTGLAAFAYLRGLAGLTFNINVLKDPSAADSEWDGSAGINGKVEMAGGVAADVSLGPAGLSGGVEGLTNAEGKVRINEGKLEYQVSWGGIQAQFQGLAFLGLPSNPIVSIPAVMGPFNIVNGATSDWRLIKDLTAD